MKQLGNGVDGWSEDVRISAKAVKEEWVAPSSVKPWWCLGPWKHVLKTGGTRGPRCCLVQWASGWRAPCTTLLPLWPNQPHTWISLYISCQRVSRILVWPWILCLWAALCLLCEQQGASGKYPRVSSKDIQMLIPE